MSNVLESPAQPARSVRDEPLPMAATSRWRWMRAWPVRDVLVPFAVTRAMLAAVAWLALLSFQNVAPNPGAWELKPNGDVAAAPHALSAFDYPLLNAFSRWDAGWYHSVAKNGYHFIAGRPSNTAFFPLYPLAMRAVHAFVPSSTDAGWMLAGVIVSNAALVIGLCYLVLLLRLDFDNETAARAVLYLLVFPTSFFFSAVYSESLFLAVTVAAFYHARRGQWLLAGAFAGAATLTRSPGILLIGPLLVEYLAQRGFRRREIRADLLSLAIIPLCLVAHMLYLRASVGNGLAVQDAQRAWGGEWGVLSWPWRPVVRFLRQPFMFNDVTNVVFTAAVLTLVVLATFRLRLSYGVYAIACYIFITSWGTYESMPRYVLVIFPAFIALARLGRHPLLDRAYVVAASGLAALFMMRFALWRWVA